MEKPMLEQLAGFHSQQIPSTDEHKQHLLAKCHAGHHWQRDMQ